MTDDYGLLSLAVGVEALIILALGRFLGRR